MRYFKKLVGDRIYLSPRNAEDTEKFTEWLNDFNVTDYVGKSSQLVTLSGEKKYLEEYSSPEATFSIVTLEDDKLIGTAGFDKIDHLNRRATLGIFIGDKDYRDKGYGTETVRLVLDYGFNYLNLNNINLTVMEFNQRAIKCYQKCGFKEVGRRRKANYINGNYYDSVLMDILKEEFNETYIRNKNI